MATLTLGLEKPMATAMSMERTEPFCSCSIRIFSR